jgi:hypothetical protein
VRAPVLAGRWVRIGSVPPMLLGGFAVKSEASNTGDLITDLARGLGMTFGAGGLPYYRTPPRISFCSCRGAISSAPSLDDAPLALGLPDPGGEHRLRGPDSDFMASDAYEGRRSRSSHLHVEAARATGVTTRLE